MPSATMLGNIMGLRLTGNAFLQPQPQLSARLSFMNLNTGFSYSAFGWSLTGLATFAFKPLANITLTTFGIGKALSNLVGLLIGKGVINLQSPTPTMPTAEFGASVIVQGPKASIEYVPSLLGIPSIIAATTGFTTQVIKAMGFPHLVVSCAFSGGGILALQRYIDSGGLVAQGAAITATAAAGATAVIDNNDGKGFLSFTINATNTAAAQSTLSSVALVMLAG